MEQLIDSMQPKKNAEDIIPREKVLTEDEEKLFTYFAKVPGLKEQILDTLCDVQMGAADKTSRTGNVIVMGGRETGKTRLISSLIPCNLQRVESGCIQSCLCICRSDQWQEYCRDRQQDGRRIPGYRKRKSAYQRNSKSAEQSNGIPYRRSDRYHRR